MRWDSIALLFRITCSQPIEVDGIKNIVPDVGKICAELMITLKQWFEVSF